MIVVRTMNVGMCNQLFTYAYARYLAEKTGQELYLDYSHISKADMKHNADYEEALGHYGLKVNGVIHDVKEYELLTGSLGRKLEHIIHPVWIRKKHRPAYLLKQEEKGNSLWKQGIGLNLNAGNIPDFFKEPAAENIILYGYWQTPFYARMMQNRLCDEMREKNNVFHTHGDIIRQMQEDNSVCVHIRRGDYVGDPMHEICNEQYYNQAMNYYREQLEHPVFYLFSDDKEYIRRTYQEYEDVKIVSGALPDYEELVIMSCCKHFILSNSSFSWWAQFLSGSRSVAAPDRWYGDPEKISHLPEDWWLRIRTDNTV